MVRRCGFCREEGHDVRRCQPWIELQERQQERQQQLEERQSVRDLIDLDVVQDHWSERRLHPIINQTIIDLRDDIPTNTPSPSRTPPPNVLPTIQVHLRPAHRPTSFPNTGGQAIHRSIIHIEATNLFPRFEEVAANTQVGTSNRERSTELVTLSNKVIEATNCAICIDELGETNKLVTRCGHQFCCGCMFIHMRSNNFCPSCRGILA